MLSSGFLAAWSNDSSTEWVRALLVVKNEVRLANTTAKAAAMTVAAMTRLRKVMQCAARIPRRGPFG